jgi:hypothetical protein
MMKISIAREQAVVEVEGFDKLWALRSHVHIPLAHITSVEANDERLAGRQQSGLQQESRPKAPPIRSPVR